MPVTSKPECQGGGRSPPARCDRLHEAQCSAVAGYLC